MTTRWARYVVPVMVEIDCNNDAIDCGVALPGETREDRDDRGQFCIYGTYASHMAASAHLELRSCLARALCTGVGDDLVQFPVVLGCCAPDHLAVRQWEVCGQGGDGVEHTVEGDDSEAPLMGCRSRRQVAAEAQTGSPPWPVPDREDPIPVCGR